MGKICPDSRPKLSLDEAKKIMKDMGAEDADVVVVGIRGYYKSMGNPDKNDRRIYDDCIAVVLKDRVVTFNGNTDPNGWRKGHGVGAEKGMATLKEGVWKAHKLGLHKGKYLALIQTGGKVTVRRDADARVAEKDIVVVDGERFYEDTGFFGANIHRGSMNNTSSLGCQTIYPKQYQEFIDLVKAELRRANIKTVQYVLKKI